MDASELRKFLALCLRALRSADDINVDITEQVIDKIRKEFAGFDFTIRSAGMDIKVPSLTHEEVNIGREKGKLDCIKVYKNRTGLSLMDSKHAVEQWFSHYDIPFFRYP